MARSNPPPCKIKFKKLKKIFTVEKMFSKENSQKRLSVETKKLAEAYQSAGDISSIVERG